MKKISKWDDWEVMKDSKVKFYTGKPVLNKRGIFIIVKKSKTCFRLVVIKTKKRQRILVFDQ